MTLEIIQAKRAALLAECERAKGAIQALDDLISEVAADRERRKAAEAEAMRRGVRGNRSGMALNDTGRRDRLRGQGRAPRIRIAAHVAAEPA